MIKQLLCTLAVIFGSVASASAVTLNMGDHFGKSNIDEITEWTQEGFTLTASSGDNTKGKVPCYKSKGKEVRLYALNTLTITSSENIKTITFVLSSQGIEEQAVITANVGSVGKQSVGNSTISWNGDATSITFTVGETNSLHPEGVVDGSGQFDFTEIIINESTTPEPVEGLVLDMGEQFGASNVDQLEGWQQAGFTFMPAIGGNAKEKVPCYKSKNKEVRFYALNTLTIKSQENTTITSITFVLSSQGIDEQAEITASSGIVEQQSVGETTIKWVGKSNEIVFSVGETNKYHPEGIVDGSGQFDFSKIIITTDNVTGLSSTTIEDFTNIDKPKEYYNLNGLRVHNPTGGIYICKEGNRTYKVALP